LLLVSLLSLRYSDSKVDTLESKDISFVSTPIDLFSNGAGSEIEGSVFLSASFLGFFFTFASWGGFDIAGILLLSTASASFGTISCLDLSMLGVLLLIGRFRKLSEFLRLVVGRRGSDELAIESDIID
jgi:hypothetical protein